MSEESLFSYPGADPLTPAAAPELVIGIVAPVGARRDTLIAILRKELREYQYQTEHIKLSNLMSLAPGHEALGSTSFIEPDRTHAYMDAGDKIREASKLGDALAILAISEIKERRKNLNKGNPDKVLQEHQHNAYIIDSLKHPDEVRTLRAVYGQGFLLISGYSRRNQRVQNLASKIAASRCNPQGVDQHKSDAEKTIQRDYNEEENPFGQKVQRCFPMGDFFVDLDAPEGRQEEIVVRFLKIVFDNPFITPRKDEAGMFHAEAASWRSSDLSRQVGAAICTPDGDVLSVGCNEAPKAFGGLYWEGDDGDGRDFQRGRNDGNDQKRLIVAEIFDRLIERDNLGEFAESRLQALKELVVQGKEDPVLKDLQALNVIEYGRTVHAEMAALCDAAARGVSVKGATMYVNTFPCHICARHIVAAGIKRLVYIEPYPKSLTGRLFDDSIVVEPQRDVGQQVAFEAFTGVAPRAYRFSFSMQSRRKDSTGQPVRWNKTGATTKMKRYITSYLAMENHVIANLLPRVRKAPGEHNENKSITGED